MEEEFRSTQKLQDGGVSKVSLVLWAYCAFYSHLVSDVKLELTETPLVDCLSNQKFERLGDHPGETVTVSVHKTLLDAASLTT